MHPTRELVVVSVAERVAEECDAELGREVGYRLSSYESRCDEGGSSTRISTPPTRPCSACCTWTLCCRATAWWWSMKLMPADPGHRPRAGPVEEGPTAAEGPSDCDLLRHD